MTPLDYNKKLINKQDFLVLLGSFLLGLFFREMICLIAELGRFINTI